MVITVLLGSIIMCVFGLLVMTFHNPREMIASEVGTIDRLEGVLRQMISEQQWPKPEGASEGSGELSQQQDSLLREQLKSLEEELREKQKQIDALSAGGAVAAAPGEEAAALAEVVTFKQKIKDLEERLAEYSVIEEDIADLSRFRQENDDLRKRVSEFTGIPPADTTTMPWDEFEKIVKEKKAKPATEAAATTIDTAE